jgi:hypothetical protein
MNYRYGRIVSWHIVKAPTRVEGRYTTLCGREVQGDILDDLRLSEKSCETCTRLAVRLADGASA